MKKYSAIAAIEFGDIPTGMVATDLMLKRAPINLVKSGTISFGRYMTLIAGSTASVDESFRAGIDAAGESIVDSVMLPDVHTAVHQAVFGKRNPCQAEAMAIIETRSVSSNIRAAELALKGTDVRLVEIRLADSLLNGKGISIYQGALDEIEAAVEIAEAFLAHKKIQVLSRIIAAPHEGLVGQVDLTTHFNKAKSIELDGEEV